MSRVVCAALGCWLMLIGAASLARASNPIFNVSPGSYHSGGFGELPPQNLTLTVTFQGQTTGMPYSSLSDQGGGSVWSANYQNGSGSFIHTFTAQNITEYDFNWLAGWGMTNYPMSGTFTAMIANVRFWHDPFADTLSEGPHKYEEDVIGLDPDSTAGLSIQLHASGGGVVSFPYTTGNVQIERFDSLSMTWVSVSGGVSISSPSQLPPFRVRSDANFSGGSITVSFMPTGAQYDTQDVVLLVDPTIELVIHNGQSGPAVGDKIGVGAFTVANQNDTDSDGMPDHMDNNGVKVTQQHPDGRDEVDLMKLIIKPPNPDVGGVVTVSAVPETVRFWGESTKETALNPMGGGVMVPVADLEKTIWVELVDPSAQLRDVEIKVTYLTGKDIAKATAIWAGMTAFRNSNPPTTLTGNPINSNPNSNQIEVVNPAGFAVDDHIIIFSAADAGHTRMNYDITFVLAAIFSLDRTLGIAWAGGDEVREGMSAEIDNPTMISTFRDGGGKLGADHVSPRTNNAMEMQFTVTPLGIGEAAGIVFDISRQKESRGWRVDSGMLISDDNLTSDFPAGDEDTNDDGSQQDEDTTPTNNLIYSRDMPGRTDDVAPFERFVLRFNMREFVRVNVNGGNFQNQNGGAEGSRCSGKALWRSRMDVIQDPASGVPDGFGGTTYKWKRNNTQPAGEVENEIVTGHKPLLQNVPSPP